MKSLRSVTVAGAYLLAGAPLVGCSGTEGEHPSGSTKNVESYLELTIDDIYSQQVAALAPEVVERIGMPELARMVGYLRERLEPTDIVHEVDVNGETFACVDWDRQPSVKKFAAEGQSVGFPQAPITPPKEVVDKFESIAATYAKLGRPAEQITDSECPSGTVPLREIPVDEIVEYGSLQKYLAKPPPAGQGYEYAYAARGGLTNYGAGSILNIWNPYVSPTGAADHSISQIWVTRGAGNSLETVEAGWVRRKNSDARLFIFTTNDNYGAADGGSVGDCSGATSCCWNADCAFVQLPGTGIYLDSVFSNYSVSGGAQYQASFLMIKNDTTGDWWFNYQGTWVGYWPRSLYDSNGIQSYADRIVFGGEVYDDVSAYHTFTDMGGDGSFPSAGHGHSAYQIYLEYAQFWGGQYHMTPASGLTAIATNSACYDINYDDSTPASGVWMHVGGPGYNSNCTQ